MSYQLSIVRKPTMSERVGPSDKDGSPVNSSLRGNLRSIVKAGIALDEWLEIVELDDAFSYIVNEGDTVSAVFQTVDAAEEVVWQGGKASAYQPSDSLVNKLMSIAQRLGAELVSDKLDTAPTTSSIDAIEFAHSTSEPSHASAHGMMVFPSVSIR